MKLAEALLLRADLQKKLASLKQRIERNIQIQEGEQPDEDPEGLMIAAQRINDDLYALISKIHRTNALATINGKPMLDMLVERDRLIERHKIIMAALTPARQISQRYSAREIKWVVTIPVKDLQKQADDVAEKIRLINITIQSANWQIDLT